MNRTRSGATNNEPPYRKDVRRMLQSRNDGKGDMNNEHGGWGDSRILVLDGFLECVHTGN